MAGRFVVGSTTSSRTVITNATPSTSSCTAISFLMHQHHTHRHHHPHRHQHTHHRPPNHHTSFPPRTVTTRANNNNFFDGFLDSVRNLANSTPIQPPATANDIDTNDTDVSSSFVPLAAAVSNTSQEDQEEQQEETTFGPLSMLAVGFLAEEFQTIREILDEIGAEEVTLVPCTDSMLNKTLGEALSIDPVPPHEDPSVRRYNANEKVLFLSGMYASEVVEVVGILKESEEVPECAFAAAVPRSWGRIVGELVEDVSADHQAMRQRST